MPAIHLHGSGFNVTTGVGTLRLFSTFSSLKALGKSSSSGRATAIGPHYHLRGVASALATGAGTLRVYLSGPLSLRANGQAIGIATCTITVEDKPDFGIPERLPWLIPDKFRRLPYYHDLVRAVEVLANEYIWQPVQQLRNIRDPSTQERIFLALTSSLLGFKYNGDVFDSDSMRRLVAGLSKYYEFKGTDYFVDFMGYINNTSFEMTALWTEDYHSFYEHPLGATAYTGGSWYLTPHVSLAYNAGVFKPVFKDLRELFYYMAPIHLVLDYLIKYYIIQTTIPIATGMKVKYIYRTQQEDLLAIKLGMKPKYIYRTVS